MDNIKLIDNIDDVEDVLKRNAFNLESENITVGRANAIKANAEGLLKIPLIKIAYAKSMGRELPIIEFIETSKDFHIDSQPKQLGSGKKN